MRENRLFVPQQMLDHWLSEERVEVEGETMVVKPEGQRFTLTTAVLFKAEVTGSPDANGLLGKVKDLEQLAQIGAEHYADSVIFGDNAYQVVEGFAGTPIRDEAEDVAIGTSLAGAARAALGERSGSGRSISWPGSSRAGEGAVISPTGLGPGMLPVLTMRPPSTARGSAGATGAFPCW
ncbi:MAG: hypothetical protein M5U28_00440 [Sandaracinaceae bacterium]|nr:hypothetical protein [Sandaracinaceae bacterium]